MDAHLLSFVIESDDEWTANERCAMRQSGELVELVGLGLGVSGHAWMEDHRRLDFEPVVLSDECVEQGEGEFERGAGASRSDEVIGNHDSVVLVRVVLIQTRLDTGMACDSAVSCDGCRVDG